MSVGPWHLAQRESYHRMRGPEMPLLFLRPRSGPRASWRLRPPRPCRAAGAGSSNTAPWILLPGPAGPAGRQAGRRCGVVLVVQAVQARALRAAQAPTRPHDAGLRRTTRTRATGAHSLGDRPPRRPTHLLTKHTLLPRIVSDSRLVSLFGWPTRRAPGGPHHPGATPITERRRALHRRNRRAHAPNLCEAHASHTLPAWTAAGRARGRWAPAALPPPRRVWWGGRRLLVTIIRLGALLRRARLPSPSGAAAPLAGELVCWCLRVRVCVCARACGRACMPALMPAQGGGIPVPRAPTALCAVPGVRACCSWNLPVGLGRVYHHPPHNMQQRAAASKQSTTLLTPRGNLIVCWHCTHMPRRCARRRGSSARMHPWARQHGSITRQHHHCCCRNGSPSRPPHGAARMRALLPCMAAPRASQLSPT